MIQGGRGRYLGRAEKVMPEGALLAWTVPSAALQLDPGGPSELVSHSVTVQCHSVPLSPCHSVTVSQCHSVPVSQCHRVTVSQCHSVTVSQCSVPVSQCHRVTVSQCSVTVSQCPSVTVFHQSPPLLGHKLQKAGERRLVVNTGLVKDTGGVILTRKHSRHWKCGFQ